MATAQTIAYQKQPSRVAGLVIGPSLKQNKHEGSSLDDLLIEDGIFAEVKASALKRVITLQVGHSRIRLSR